ncbi:MAG TPA: Crp/Fnr family transcriptional regulator [Chryseolinea sp.]
MKSSESLDALANHINRFTELTSSEKVLLSEFVQFKEVKNKEYLLKAGQVCKANHFVVKGCFRMFSHTDKGTEQIIQFGIDNWWIADYTSLESQQSSPFYIQALEPGIVGVLDRTIQDDLFARLPKLERYFRYVLQRAYAATLMRVHFIFSESGEERYRNFNSSFPEFVQRIPQYMLASYLGFTPEFLSKIRARKD